jgi:hypothetical protein
VDNGWDTFGRLDQVGQEGVLQQGRDGPLDLQIPGQDWSVIGGKAYQNAADLGFEFRVGAGEA